MRLDIQGLRALAVVLVVVFHLMPAALPGGYIGVDVFFVISGFLITAHLLREVERTGTVSLSQFWARRVRRLLPAAFLVLVVSALLALLLLPKTVLIQNLIEIALAALYVLNWGLAANSVDYLAEGNAASLAQHYWSLSVEEQFYLVWPVLIVAAVWAAKQLRGIGAQQAIAFALVLVFVGSFAFSIYETVRSQPSAYFITITRAWEFAAGGLVALVPSRIRTGQLHVFLSWCAVFAIGGSAAVFDAETAFPGWVAAVPVAATAYLLWAGDDGSTTWGPQYFAKAAPVQLIGNTSYAIYLWHWPLIVVATHELERAPGWKWALLIAGVTVLLALATKYLVEDPVRATPRPWMKRRAPTYGFMAAGMVVVCAISFGAVAVERAVEARFTQQVESLVEDTGGCFGAYAIVNDCPAPYEQTDTVNPQAAAADTIAANTDPRHCNVETISGMREVSCRFGDGEPRIVVLGDSHAEHLAPALERIAEERDWTLEIRARSGCSGFEPQIQNPSPVYAACSAWGSRVHEEVSDDPEIDAVILSVLSLSKDDYSRQAESRIRALLEAGKQTAVVRPVPGLWAPDGSISVPQCVERAKDTADPCATPFPDNRDWLVDAGQRVGAQTIDLREILCSDEECHMVIGGTIAFADTNHLTGTFARTLAPWIAGEMESLILEESL